VPDATLHRLAPEPDWMRDPTTRRVMAALAAAGPAPRFVGGCVRNALLGRPVEDIDIATPLAPEAVMAALRAAGIKAVPTGIAHGTVTAVADHRPFEITTLRVDVETHGRHATVAFTDDWQADAARRDFTMNALSAEIDGTVHDYFGGIEDARAGRVVFVGDAARRIAEDYLRILRFFRFHAHYGRVPPDAATRAAIRGHVAGLDRLSGERLRQELRKLLLAPDPVPAWRLAIDAGAAAAVIGEDGAVDRLAGLVALEPEADWIRRLAGLLTLGPDAVPARADRLRLSNAEKKRLVALCTPPPDLPADADGPALRAWLWRQGVADGRDRLQLLLAGAPADDPRRALLPTALAWDPPRFPLTGRDVARIGIPPGPRTGALLRAVEDWWIARDFAPDRDACLAELARRAAD
jgi:poly(A) polymerase